MKRSCLLFVVFCIGFWFAVGCSGNDETPTQKEFEQSQTKGTDLDPAYNK